MEELYFHLFTAKLRRVACGSWCSHFRCTLPVQEESQNVFPGQRNLDFWESDHSFIKLLDISAWHDLSLLKEFAIKFAVASVATEDVEWHKGQVSAGPNCLCVCVLVFMANKLTNKFTRTIAKCRSKEREREREDWLDFTFSLTEWEKEENSIFSAGDLNE